MRMPQRFDSEFPHRGRLIADCEWVFELDAAPGVALGVGVVVVSCQLHFDSKCRCRPGR